MAKDAVISLRLTTEEAERLREFAAERGRPASEIIRGAINRLIRKPIGWQCDHFNITGPAGVLTDVTGLGCCELEPVFEPDDLRRRAA